MRTPKIIEDILLDRRCRKLIAGARERHEDRVAQCPHLRKFGDPESLTQFRTPSEEYHGC